MVDLTMDTEQYDCPFIDTSDDYFLRSGDFRPRHRRKVRISGKVAESTASDKNRYQSILRSSLESTVIEGK